MIKNNVYYNSKRVKIHVGNKLSYMNALLAGPLSIYNQISKLTLDTLQTAPLWFGEYWAYKEQKTIYEDTCYLIYQFYVYNDMLRLIDIRLDNAFQSLTIEQAEEINRYIDVHGGCAVWIGSQEQMDSVDKVEHTLYLLG